jgi:hypothetical protein
MCARGRNSGGKLAARRIDCPRAFSGRNFATYVLEFSRKCAYEEPQTQHRDEARGTLRVTTVWERGPADRMSIVVSVR